MTLPVQAVGSISATGPVLSQAAARPEALQVLGERFGRLMEAQPEQASAPVRPAGEPSVVQQFVSQQESVLHQTFDDVRVFSAQAPSMTPQQLAARQIELMHQISTVQLQFNAGVYVSQSTKTGLQTLMKNQ